MTFPFKMLQACQFFIANEVLFHPGAAVKAKDLYSRSVEYLLSIGLQDCGVTKQNFWSLFKLCVPEEVKGYLDKRNSKHLYYRGVDLKCNALPDSLLSQLQHHGARSKGH